MKKYVLLTLPYILWLFVVLFSCGNAWAAKDQEQEKYFRGEVVRVDEFSDEPGTAAVQQEAEVQITSGQFSGESVVISNTYCPEDPYLDVYLQEGSRIILAAFVQDGVIQDAGLHDVQRDRGLYYLLGIFLILLLTIGRLQGLKTIITLIFTGLVEVKVILPL